MLYSTVWYPTILYCTLLHCIILYFTILYCIILYCIMLFHTILYYTIRSIILYYTILYAGRPWRPPGPEVQKGLGGGHAPQRGIRGAELKLFRQPYIYTYIYRESPPRGETQKCMYFLPDFFISGPPSPEVQGGLGGGHATQRGVWRCELLRHSRFAGAKREVGHPSLQLDSTSLARNATNRSPKCAGIVGAALGL